MKNRKRWILSIVILVILIGAAFFYSHQQQVKENAKQKAAQHPPLPVPALLKDTNPDPKVADFTLSAQQGKKSFVSGKMSTTYGYNGSYLGPVIRVKRGEQVNMIVKNKLKEVTTVHWHGLLVPGTADGGPHNQIAPGKTWKVSFMVNQPAATLWYHPHPMGKTGKQVYKGLAGLFYIDDQNSESLDIPNKYGKNDFPLVLQDRRFNKSGQLSYKLDMNDQMFGFQGTTELVNGAVKPQLKVKRGLVRLRILNGANGRTYHLHLSGKQTFTQIASDGGLLKSPVKLKNLTLSAGERAEILVDFSALESGGTLQLKNGKETLMYFKAKGKDNKQYRVPQKLATIDKIPVSEAVKTRTFVMKGMGPDVNINGKQMKMDRIDEKVKLNSVEIWNIKNASTSMGTKEMVHPFHIHGVQFQIISINGKTPPLNEQGWKDTVLVNPGETVKVIMRFPFKGIYMYHCHILEHEDLGMMGQYEVK
ncbi:multicopper oxidase family protein [Heyndrickxia acidiproducens]|uniref:multicopper oxidase family protein n=1 Tax=Heyndrickxia acidiproducens TaxID=1121084 RepID=UPI0003635B80|nr:multicopper oxidase domain-containing protein [Heyndrickxia acidiproducens]